MIIKSIGLKVFILPLSLALVVMISVIFIKPVLEDMNSNRKALAEKKERLAALKEQTRKLNELKSAFESLEERRIVAVALPEGENAEDYLNELYQRASRSGILVSSFSVSKKNSAGSVYICNGLAEASQVLPVASLEAGAGGESLENSSDVSVGAPNSVSCVQSSTAQISVKGTWDQLLNFYKYLADSNRITNLSEVSINAKRQTIDENPTDLLASQITLNIFYKVKNGTGNMATIKALTEGVGLNKTVLKKLEEIIYTPYEAPVVTETGERNFFK